jgi:hypothetical protein
MLTIQLEDNSHIILNVKDEKEAETVESASGVLGSAHRE